MRIGIVGGLDRSGHDLERAARAAGHQLEFHDGKLNGPGAAALSSMIDRSDLVVVVTDINSHGAMYRTKEALRRAGRGAMYVRKVGKSWLRRLLEQLDEPTASAPVLAV